MVPDYVLKFAPLVWLHSEDPFRPSDLLEHVRHTTPEVNYKPVPDLPELNLENLAVLNDPDELVALTAHGDDVAAVAPWLKGQEPDASGRITNVTACVVVLIEKSPTVMDAFYWYFYSYDRGPNITQVTEPLNGIFGDSPPSYSFGDHVGDWEHNMIRFQDGEPQGIFYSQHRDGTAYQWDDEAVSKQDGRPIVYSAFGSHANYPNEGDNLHDIVLIDYCDAGTLWDPVLSAYAYQLDTESYTMSPLSLTDSDELPPAGVDAFIHYKGVWGDEQYPDSNEAQQTVPYFGLKRYVTGPTGPIMKRLIRDGLSPKPRKGDWKEGLVAIFMAWYPCCIRGWRKWIFLIVIVLLLGLLGLGIGYFVKKVLVKRLAKWLRRKQYTRLDAEIPLEDFEDLASASSSPSRRLSNEERID